VCRSKHVEQSRNIGIINSTTRSHLVGYFYTICIMMHGSMNIKVKAYMISVRKPEGKRPLEGPRNRWDNIKIENCALLGYYTASSGNLLPRVRNNLSLPRLSCSETSARNYHYLLPNNPEERSSRPLSGRSLKT
jgi:hypothetical protein